MPAVGFFGLRAQSFLYEARGRYQRQSTKGSQLGAAAVLGACQLAVRHFQQQVHSFSLGAGSVIAQKGASRRTSFRSAPIIGGIKAAVR
jgi:hypothetical protein